jgi:glucan biosynthesis protein C
MVFTAVLAWLLPRTEGWLRDTRVTWPVLLLALTAATYACNLASRVVPGAYQQVLGLTSLYSLANYLPFFLVGAWMYRAHSVRAAFLRVPVAFFPVALIAAVLAVKGTVGKASWGNELAEIVVLLATWMAVASVLHGFHAVFPRRSRATHFFGDVSYTVYLFHHVIVVALGLLLLPLPWPAWLKFGYVCVATFVLAAAIHMGIIRRVPMLRLLFNGK